MKVQTVKFSSAKSFTHQEHVWWCQCVNGHGTEYCTHSAVPVDVSQNDDPCSTHGFLRWPQRRVTAGMCWHSVMRVPGSITTPFYLSNRTSPFSKGGIVWRYFPRLSRICPDSIHDPLPVRSSSASISGGILGIKVLTNDDYMYPFTKTSQNLKSYVLLHLCSAYVFNDEPPSLYCLGALSIRSLILYQSIFRHRRGLYK